MAATGTVPTEGRGGGQHDEAGPGHPGCSLGGEQQYPDDGELLPERQSGMLVACAR